MKITETKLKGAYIIDLEFMEDDRGFFGRTFCKEEFSKYQMKTDIKQCNLSFNKVKATFRGMHMQISPYQEAKYVRCIRGSIYDIIIDLRDSSSTYKKWIGVELTSENRRMLYIPEGFAHGFITLEDCSEVFYQMAESFYPQSAIGYCWNDPEFNIILPTSIKVISQKDLSYKPFENKYD